MIVEVLNTGSELLLGEVVNTHAAWFGKVLFPLGLQIGRQTTVPDGRAIRGALMETIGRADIVLVTGGLGPTTDDLTREITSELLGLRLVESEVVKGRIAERLARRGIPLRERMLRQAMVPETAVILQNDHGTAPGLYLPAGDGVSSSTPHLFLLPGPPRELHPMFLEQAVPLLREIARGLDVRECRVYRVVGMGESEVEERIGLELSRDGRFEIGYCARPNEVDFRVMGVAADMASIEERILSAIGDFLVARDGRKIEEVVVGKLIEFGATVTAAESCTGGLLLHRITNVPGASAVLRQGFVTYANDFKSETLGVAAELISRFGAVSAEVAEAMAAGALERAQADYAVALTGIAGPGGGTAEKPVGLLYIGLAKRGAALRSREFRFPTDRETFKDLATQAGLDMLRRELTGARDRG
jgi:nicotinamide-nucleotide amidase